jgi:hypothetical protein
MIKNDKLEFNILPIEQDNTHILLEIFNTMSNDIILYKLHTYDWLNFSVYQDELISGVFLEVRDTNNILIEKAESFYTELDSIDINIDIEKHKDISNENIQSFKGNLKNITKSVFEDIEKNTLDEIHSKSILLKPKEKKYLLLNIDWLSNIPGEKRIKLHYRVSRSLFDFIGKEYITNNTFLGSVVTSELIIRNE